MIPTLLGPTYFVRLTLVCLQFILAFNKSFLSLTVLLLLQKLKILLIGDSTKTIGIEWSGQYFDFDTRLPELWYGLVQHHGGPCGLLAVVQGYLCAEFFHHHQVNPSEKELACLETYRYRCLARAIATLLWQIGGSKHKVVIAL